MEKKSRKYRDAKKTTTESRIGKTSKKIVRRTQEPIEKEVGTRSTVFKAISKKISKQWAIKIDDKVVMTYDVMDQNSHFFSEKYIIRKGLTYPQLKPMIEFLGYNQKESAVFLDVDPGTISRWKLKKQVIGKFRTKTLLDIDEIIAKGVRIFGSEEKFKEWLNTTNYALGDVEPIELLKDPYGVEQVEEAIDGLSWGTYV